MLNKDMKLQLVVFFTCLDYCNILYYGTSSKLLLKQQEYSAKRLWLVCMWCAALLLAARHFSSSTC